MDRATASPCGCIDRADLAGCGRRGACQLGETRMEIAARELRYRRLRAVGDATQARREPGGRDDAEAGERLVAVRPGQLQGEGGMGAAGVVADTGAQARGKRTLVARTGGA